jgi:hypothetical protein
VKPSVFAPVHCPVDTVTWFPTAAVPTMTGKVTLTGGSPLAAICGERFEYVEPEPLSFVATTWYRTFLPTSSFVSV